MGDNNARISKQDATMAAVRPLWGRGRARCLVVDDESSAIEVVRSCLSSWDVEVVSASSGREALEQIAQETPDCVILDIMMPGMDGFDVCKKIKERWSDEHIPVVMLTALTGRRERVRAWDVGADDFLQKPIQPMELVARLRSSLMSRELNQKLSEKVQALEVVEKSRVQELRHLTEFLTFADRSLWYFDPNRRDDEAHCQMLLQQLIQRGPKDVTRPAIVLMATKTEQGGFEGFLYTRHGAEIRRYPGPLTITKKRASVLFPPDGEVVYANQNTMGKDDVLSYRFDRFIRRTIGPMQNYVSCALDTVGVVAFNYGSEVGSFAAHLLRSFVLHSSVLHRLANQAHETEEAFVVAIETLARASEANDEDTANHLTRVNEYSRVLALALGCSDEFVRQIHYSAQMHDVGKIHVPREILRKPGRLTDDEWAAMIEHPLYGARILGDAPALAMAREIALCHHEKFDGTGYPRGLKAEQIPLSARIVSVADVYDALRSSRPYKEEFTHEKSVDIILNGDGRVDPSHFDPDVLAVFRVRQDEFKTIHAEFRDAPCKLQAPPLVNQATA